MIKTFYRLITPASNKAGIYTAAPGIPYNLIRDGKPIETNVPLVFTLRGGMYAPFDMSGAGGYLASEEFKNFLEPFCTPETGLEFIPVEVVSEKYGDRTYYILHFTKLHDVVDLSHCDIGPAGNIIKLAVDAEKVGTLDVFNSTTECACLLVSEKVYKAMKKMKFQFPPDAGPIYCYNYPDDSKENNPSAKTKTGVVDNNKRKTHKATALPPEILDRLHAWGSEAEKPQKSDGIDCDSITRTLGIWVIDIALHNKLPKGIEALNFDIFETGEPSNAYAVNLTGARVYDPDNDDWACEEDFVPSQRYAPALNVPSSVGWNELLDAMVIILRDIIAQTDGLHLWNVKHITTGFSDGDLAVVK